MPTSAERLTQLMELHGDSYRSAAELCGLDHTTLMRVAKGETDNPATLAKIAEGYGVPINWVRGERDLAMDFTCAVLSRPLQERVMFLWERRRRVAYAMAFLHQYDPARFTIARLADLLQLPASEVEGNLAEGSELLATSALDRLCTETGLPVHWFQTGLIGREDEEELLVGMGTAALTALKNALGAEVTDEEIQEAIKGMV